MEDRTPMILLILAGLVVAFVLWRRHQQGAGISVTTDKPGFGGAGPAGGAESNPAAVPVPVQAPIMRGSPPPPIPATSYARPALVTAPLLTRASSLGALKTGVSL
jgi:hypothetical protein